MQRAGHLWEHLPQDAANQRLGCQSPHFTVAEIYIDNLPFAIDGTESVPEGLEDVSVNADKSVFVDCSKAGAETSKGSEAHNRRRTLAFRGSETLRIRRHMRATGRKRCPIESRISYIDVDRRADDRGNLPNGRVPDRAGGAREGARAT